MEEKKNIKLLRKKQSRVQNNEQTSSYDIVKFIQHLATHENNKVNEDVDVEEDEEKEYNVQMSLNSDKKLLVLPWWMRIIEQEKNKLD